MNAKLCAVHTHSTLCDGKQPLAEMAAAAYDAGVKYYGVSCHSHTPVPHDEGNVLDADMAAYRAEVLRLRTEYADRMEVLLGLEWDALSDVSPEGFDYWIGSVHNLYDREQNAYHAIDWDREKLAACRDEMFGGDALAMVEGYFAEVARVAAMKPTILGHIDLITKLNGEGEFFDETHPRYRAAALAALHAADPAATLLEINTGAMARGYRAAPYPASFLLEEWRRMGGRVIITADVHHMDHMLYGYDQAAEAAKAAGFETGVLLTLNGPVEYPL